MRVTNSMIYGTSMNNIWRNARHLNNLVTQLETGKKIQRPSDDPLLSARSLRYRTILAEAEQFTRNVQQGMAWMEVSESALNSILTGNSASPSLMQRVYTRLVEGTQTGTQTLDDQRAILEELKQYFDQMFNVDMNQTYLGRFVFSGFHTNLPPVLNQDLDGRSFVVQQTFGAENIERTIAFHRPNIVSDLEVKPNVNIIKLPYAEVDFSAAIPAGAPALGITLPDGTTFEIVNVISTDEDAYSPGNFHANPDGSLILDAQGRARPMIHHVVDTGELIISDEVRRLIEAMGDITVTYEKSDMKAGELNPIVYFESWEVTDGDVQSFSTRGQNIQTEISPNTYITVNSHARDILTANLYSDLRRLFDFADSLQPSDPAVIRAHFAAEGRVDDDLNNAVEDFLRNEAQLFAAAMHIRMNNMLGAIMEHTTQAQREHTSLGSRMARLEMVGIRLQDDEVAYTALLAENEDTDLAHTIQRKSAASSAFNIALNAIARTVQLSLADFIQR